MNILKSFEEFWSSITEDKLNAIVDAANERSKNVNPSDIGTQVGIQSIMMTKQILNLYHDWLSEQLEK